MSTSTARPLRYAMVGGGRDAFIGGIHRHAIALDGQAQLVTGALSSTPDKARASGRDLGLPDARTHVRWQDLLEDELRGPADERIDFVSIVMPNHLHFPVARAFVEAGFHVVCDKPLVHRTEEAEVLEAAVQRAGTVFAVTYNYSGYPMVREARELVRAGAIGRVRKVIVEYQQGWLATAVDSKQAAWRGDPAQSGMAGAIGDIGSHAEQLMATVTGLQIEALCADLSCFVPGRTLDDDGNLLIRFAGGAKGVLIASQVAVGCENDIRLRVHGETGTLEWRQEAPNLLHHLPADGPRRILTRGAPWLSVASRAATRTPPGHPEAFIEAFANVYAGAIADMRAHAAGTPRAQWAGDYPGIADGVRGVRFIERTVASAASREKWTRF